MQPGHAQAPLQAPHSINAFGELSTGVRESSSERESTQRESKYLDLDLVANILRSYLPSALTWWDPAWAARTHSASGMPTLSINDSFPNLRGETQTDPEFDLYAYFGESWGIIFMHPGDFTPVCTTELGAAAALSTAFEERNVKLCGFSCNDAASHQAWLADILSYTGQTVEFPLFCDPTRSFATEIGVLDVGNKDAKGLPLTVRSVFVLSPDKVIKAVVTYPASTGRNFDEIIRLVDSLQLTASKSVATPAGWQPGKDVIVNFPLTDAQAESKFGKGGFTVIGLPSEENPESSPWGPDKHYLRVLPDPTTAKATSSAAAAAAAE